MRRLRQEILFSLSMQRVCKYKGKQNFSIPLKNFPKPPISIISESIDCKEEGGVRYAY